MEKSGRKELEEELANLKAELKERELSLPASLYPGPISCQPSKSWKAESAAWRIS